ncbi:molybdate ABC transporter substrate-binding protein [Krasilnikovia sp. M28-CT-15]
MVATLLAFALSGSSAGCERGRRPTTTIGDALAGSVTVLAAASLKGAFDQIGAAFEAAHPGTKTTFSYGGSDDLARQVVSGMRADVFAAASAATMRTVTDAEYAVGTPDTFARNQLVIAVPEGNPMRVRSLADLARPGVRVALCAAQVPCGAATDRVLGAAGAALTPVAREPDVRATLATLRRGAADAALVYRTDVRAAGPGVDAVEFPESAQAINAYPIAVLKNAPNPAGAAAFVAYVLGPQAQQMLADAGFQRP